MGMVINTSVSKVGCGPVRHKKFFAAGVGVSEKSDCRVFPLAEVVFAPERLVSRIVTSLFTASGVKHEVENEPWEGSPVFLPFQVWR
jgi:hypothetical protein